MPFSIRPDRRFPVCCPVAYHFVTAVIVRWIRGPEYGVETLVVDKQTQRRLEHWVNRLALESVESLP